jgi:hypothetical protein
VTDIPVHRLRPLLTGPSRGRLLIASAVIEVTTSALQKSAGDDGRHEGIVLWLGRAAAAADTLIVSATVPESEHTRGSVHIGHAAVARASRAARRLGLVVAAQVHSHPGSDTRHSDGDDEMILLPYEGMFSLVVASYGDGPAHASDGAGLHQYQDGQWVQVDNPATAMVVVPPEAT